jgi:hypothetical protein
MTPAFVDPFVRNYHQSPVNDLIVFTYQAADKAQAHRAFQGPLPDYVTLPPIADSLGVARDAASGHDENKMAEQRALMEVAVRALDHNSYHIALFSNHHKDPSLLQHSGYEVKPPKVTKARVNLVDLVPVLTVKHLESVSGGLIIIMKLAKYNANTELQWTETPDNEASWGRVGEGNYDRSRIELRGYEPARRIYFRVRYHERGAVGAWSAPVSIIVL